jgi:hypothetical protein
MADELRILVLLLSEPKPAAIYQPIAILGQVAHEVKVDLLRVAYFTNRGD